MSLAARLQEALENGSEVHPSDDELLALAAELVAKDPKKRFGANGLRQAIAAKHGVQYVKLNPTIEKRVDALLKARKIIADKVRGYYKLAKTMSGSGVELRPVSGGSFEILVNGEHVGDLVYAEGARLPGGTERRPKVYTVTLYDDGPMPPDDFATLTAAKKWIQAHLG